MTRNRFTIEVNGETFHFIRVNEEGDRFYLYVLPNDSSKNGFFMTQTNGEAWQIANKVLVMKSILLIEQELSELVAEKLGQKTP
ncbi:MAG: hypothetical protein H6550_15210 [Chitinophagales bacterium]|nr:hypothetical protein [Chitinophagales bacterium]